MSRRLASPVTIVSLIAVLCGALVGHAADPIPIGVSVAQTGPVALAGQEQVLGAQIAEEYFNKRGGVNGRPFKLIFQDAGSDEATAINAYQNQINVAKVVAIIGPSLSQQMFAAGPFAVRAKLPVLGISTTAKGIPQVGEFVSRVSAPVAIVAPNAIKAAMDINKNIKRVVVLYAQNDAFSKSETETFQQAVKDLHLELVTVQTFQTTDTDFTAQVTNTLNAKPDLVIISGLQVDGANLVKQLRELAYKGLIVGGNGLNTTNIIPICKALCDGILVAQAYSPEYKSKINDDFKGIYKDRQKKDPPQFSAQAFTGVQVFVEALGALDKKSPIAKMDLAALRVELNKQLIAGTYDTPLGEISFKASPGGEIVQKQSYVAQIKMDPGGTSGKWVYVK
ncbi:MAG: branched-chain amino acid ABC transporter substrate-binding protein [Candidatus Rokubacteria bacterium 13_1_40CM_68_15]|nr:MAG: branched-chain amino acid ABC transporter substrate-binding protein [Candidatus Rokubacteria bacterium 13_1_40CM_68_15]